MLPIIITLMLLITTALIFRFIHYSTFSKKEKKDLFLQLNLEGVANNLIFCSQEMFQNKVIGIDGIHRKILILEKNKRKYNSSLISLNEVQNCKLITRYKTLKANEDTGTKKSLFAIELQFEFRNRAKNASIMIYDSFINSQRELILLKAKAEYWSIMLSKMITRPVRVSA